MNAKVVFADALEASAYTVLLVSMAGKDYAPNINSLGDGKFEVELVKPVPIQLHEVILQAIAHDKATNPKKWEDTRASIQKGKSHVSDYA